MPEYLAQYIETHQFEQVVNETVNRILKEKPADPLSEIASLLMNASQKSYPTFAGFKARNIFLQDNVTLQSVRISVFLSYKGRKGLKY